MNISAFIPQEKFYCETCHALHSIQTNFCLHCGGRVSPLESKDMSPVYLVDTTETPLKRQLFNKMLFQFPTILFYPIIFTVTLFNYCRIKIRGTRNITPIKLGNLEFWRPYTKPLPIHIEQDLREIELLDFTLLTVEENPCFQGGNLRLAFSHIEHPILFILSYNVQSKALSHKMMLAIGTIGETVTVDTFDPQNVITQSSKKHFHFPHCSNSELLNFLIKEIRGGSFYRIDTAQEFRQWWIPHMRSVYASLVASGEVTCQEIKIPLTNKTAAPCTCFNHNERPAVRTCISCGIALCEECYCEQYHQVYCHSCTPPIENSIGQPQPEKLYAGRSLRLAALTTDTLSLYLLFIFLQLPTLIFISNPLLEKSISIVTLLSFFLYIFICFRSGSSPGKKIWGITIVDQKDGPLSGTAKMIRMAYKIVSLLFLFPICTFIPMLFRREGIAVHDKLSETLALAKSKKRKVIATIALIPLLLLLLSTIAGTIYLFNKEYVDEFFESRGGTLRRSGSYRQYKPGNTLTNLIEPTHNSLNYS